MEARNVQDGKPQQQQVLGPRQGLIRKIIKPKSFWSPRPVEPKAESPDNRFEKTMVVKDYMAWPDGEHVTRELTCRHFAIFLILSLSVFIVLAFLLRSSPPSARQMEATDATTTAKVSQRALVIPLNSSSGVPEGATNDSAQEGDVSEPLTSPVTDAGWT